MKLNKILLIIFWIIIFLIFSMVWLLWPSIKACLIGKNNPGYAIYVNWNIKIPKCEKFEYIFTFESIEGKEFSVYEYNNPNEVIDYLNLELIDDSNQEKIKDIIDDFYSGLHGNKKTKFDERMTKKNLLSIGNYYLYKEEDDDYILFIFDSDNKLYILESSQ